MFFCLADEKIKLEVLACSFEITELINSENLGHFPCSQCVAFVEDGSNQLFYRFRDGRSPPPAPEGASDKLLYFFRIRDGRSPPPAPGGASDKLLYFYRFRDGHSPPPAPGRGVR
jgi:hypothetical protein